MVFDYNTGIQGYIMSNKTGRNDPCPCGSGKKYKKCCVDKYDNVVNFPGPDERAMDESLKRYRDFVEGWDFDKGPAPTFNEFMGQPNIATETLHDMGQFLEGKDFGSLDEMNAYMQNVTEAQNNAPLDEFLGLSPSQMSRILRNPIDENKDIVQVNSAIMANQLDAVPALKQARYLLERIGSEEKGVKATKKGNLPRAMVREFYELFVREHDILEHVPSGEDDVIDVNRTKIFLRDNGFIKLRNGRYSLTKKGTVMLEDFDPLALYLRQFTFFMEEFNWLYWTRHSDSMAFLQASRLFCLYLLHKKASDFVGGIELAELYMAAFPHLIEEEHPEYGHIFVRGAFFHLFLEGAARYLGLVESGGEATAFASEMDYRTTELFRELLIWKI